MTLLSDWPSNLSAYFFADSRSSKFLSERITSQVSYINQLPTQLLYGPASPTSYIHQLHPRYTPEMFSQPRPQIIELAPEVKIQKAFLPPIKQRPGFAVGFFEQGILIGLGITLCVVIPTVSYGIYWMGRTACKYVSFQRQMYICE